MLQTAVQLFDGRTTELYPEAHGCLLLVGCLACVLERYTRVLMKASLEFPIHFLKIYSIRRLGSGAEGSQPRGPGPGTGSCCKPGGNAHKGRCGGNQPMHEPRFHPPAIPGAPQTAHACALGHRTCDACATGLPLLESFCLWPCPCGLEEGVWVPLSKA